MEYSDSEQNETIKPAEPILRAINFIIDTTIIVILGFLTGLLIVEIFGFSGVYFLDSLPSFTIPVTIIFVYYIFLESLFGKTLGKFLTGTKVINENGEGPTFFQVCARTLSRLIPFEPFSYARDDSRGWHDSIPRTYVIKDE